jgi:glutamate 5-kinase
VYELDEKIMSLGGGAGTSRGTGGMQTKLRAAKIATDAGCDMIITNGERPDDLYTILDKKPIGTRFFAEKRN